MIFSTDDYTFNFTPNTNTGTTFSGYCIVVNRSGSTIGPKGAYSINLTFNGGTSSSIPYLLNSINFPVYFNGFYFGEADLTVNCSTLFVNTAENYFQYEYATFKIIEYVPPQYASYANLTVEPFPTIFYNSNPNPSNGSFWEINSNKEVPKYWITFMDGKGNSNCYNAILEGGKSLKVTYYTNPSDPAKYWVYSSPY
jgi:hypothetical protein